MSRDTALEAGRWRVRFFRRADRYAHLVELAGETLLVSVEGTPQQDWPASPPLQNLHIDHRGERAVALLVGMAGSSHWSLSVELDPSGVTFDAACRTRGEAGVLGSRYATPAEAARLEANQLQFALPAAQALLRTEPLPEQAAASLDLSHQESTHLILSPAPCGDAAPRTYRWRYVVSAL